MIHRGNFEIADLGCGLYAHWSPGTNIEIREHRSKHNFELRESYEVWDYDASKGEPDGGEKLAGPYNTWDEAVLAWSMLK